MGLGSPSEWRNREIADRCLSITLAFVDHVIAVPTKAM